MKKIVIGIFLLLLTNSYAQSFLYELSENIDNYKNKNITMIMKLKYYDTLFQVITFYDAKNHDISFDCIDVMKQPWFLQQKNNLHPGMEYHVTFTVKGLGNMKEIIAQLQYFEPVTLQKIP